MKKILVALLFAVLSVPSFARLNDPKPPANSEYTFLTNGKPCFVQVGSSIVDANKISLIQPYNTSVQIYVGATYLSVDAKDRHDAQAYAMTFIAEVQRICDKA